jgi:hypothetical protein
MRSAARAKERERGTFGGLELLEHEQGLLEHALLAEDANEPREESHIDQMDLVGASPSSAELLNEPEELRPLLHQVALCTNAPDFLLQKRIGSASSSFGGSGRWPDESERVSSRETTPNAMS